LTYSINLPITKPMINLLHGDCLEQMKTLDDNSVDAILSDPPYGISFMAKKWDYDVPKVEVWKEAMRVLKPGGHALIACGTRTQHRMVCNIEDAGFEIRDVVSWIYGSGFPKSLNVSKAIDKAAGAEREVVGTETRPSGRSFAEGASGFAKGEINITAPATDEAKQWDGWGTALKPACEFFTLCRKPLSEKTVAANVLKWGTGGINIDGCRVGTEGGTMKVDIDKDSSTLFEGGRHNSGKVQELNEGRFPANLIHDGSQEVLDLFPETAGGGASTKKNNCEGSNTFKGLKSTGDSKGRKTSKGSAARFFKSINDLDDVPETDFGNIRAFYCPKASKKDRNEGCEELEEKESKTLNEYKNPSEGRTASKSGSPKKNNHPTVKPTALMAYLCRLITPTGGVVLDPYMGSGSTGKAAVREGFSFVGIELDPEYYEICKARVS
jgi:DNA modification methylase